MLHRSTALLCCLLLAVSTTVVAFSPQPLAQQHRSATTATITTIRYLQSNENNNININNINDSHATSKSVTTAPTTTTTTVLQNIWNRMDTLEASGINRDYANHPPLVQRGGGFKRFMVIMTVGMAYKWYRARFINKIPFWEKQPQWNMVVTTKEQEDALRAYTCLNCGSSIFIARNREWYFEGGTGLAGLGCYACGAKGKDNFVMDRERLKDEVGDEDDYYDFERPLDFVTAAERRQLLKETAGDEEAANAKLVGQAEAAGAGGDPAETPMFGLTVEEAEAKKVIEQSSNDDDDDDDDAVSDDDDEGEDAPRIIVPPPAPEDNDDGDDDLGGF